MCKQRDNLAKIMQMQKEEEEQQQQQQHSRSSSSTEAPSPRLSIDISCPPSPSSAMVILPPPAVNTTSKRSISATLLVRKSDKGVLYMEAGKDAVDALLSFLTLPIGSALKLLRDGGIGGAAAGLPPVAVSSLYTSTLEMDESLMYADKELLLDPPRRIDEQLQQLQQQQQQQQQLQPSKRVYYKCSNHGCLRFVIDLPGQICPVCKFAMSHKLELILPGRGPYPPSSSPASSSAATPTAAAAAANPPPSFAVAAAASRVSPPRKQRSGFVKKNRCFIVTDSLEILPLSTIKSVLLLSSLNLDSLQDVESKQIALGHAEILGLLKASLSSQTALNDVFGPKA